MIIVEIAVQRCLSHRKVRDDMQKVKYDNATKKWLEKHIGANTTVCRCDYCGLYYKPMLGHECKEIKK